MKLLTKSTIALCCGILFVLATTLLVAARPSLEQTGYAKLRIYQKGYIRSGFGIKINDQMLIKSFKRKSWIEVEVPVGTLTLETVPEIRYSTNKGKSFSLKVEAGQVYYLEAIIDYEFLASTMYLVLREKVRAEAEIKRLKQEKDVPQKLE